MLFRNNFSLMLYVFLAATSLAIFNICYAGNFTVDYKRHTFLKDGEPFRYISGSLHYYRVPAAYWKDRLLRMQAMGLDTVQFYVPWNIHQPFPGVTDWSGSNNLSLFLDTAKSLGMNVLLRLGPYICAEEDFGGFPWWLYQLQDNYILRSLRDEAYVNSVKQWFEILLPVVKPHLYINGGSILMVQVENEYGSYFACDAKYMQWLVDMVRQYLGPVQIYTTDGNGDSLLKCGSTPDAYATVDFGVTGNVSAAFAPQRRREPDGPLVNSEFYTGWLDNWGHPFIRVDSQKVANTIDAILSLGANINLYMAHGGTSFGFWNGANADGAGNGYSPVITSYDYNAPISEAGDVTEKFLAIRNVISKYKKVPPLPLPYNTTKEDYGRIQMQRRGSIFDLLTLLSPQGSIETTFPINMEKAGAGYGFVLYRTYLKDGLTSGDVLDCTAVMDRAVVLVGEKVVGITYRNDVKHIVFEADRSASYLDLLVENMGRINFGSSLNLNRKGIVGNISLNGEVLSGWSTFVLNGSFSVEKPLSKDIHSTGTEGEWSSLTPALYEGEFIIHPEVMPSDSFLDTSKWGKGVVYVNGYNLGRYWPKAGPQITLYVPGPYLLPYPSRNKISVFEVEWAPCTPDYWSMSCFMDFRKDPVIDGAVIIQ